MKAAELFQAGDLNAAIAAATDAVKSNPGDQSARGLLAELLCFSGDLERADKQLDALMQLDPQTGLGATLFRQLIRAEQARQDFFREGRVPEVLEQPSEHLQLRLKASVALRAGAADEAAALLAQAEEQRTPVSGQHEGERFEDFRDLDDLTASVFEVLTSTGKYYWIPMDLVELIEFRPYERPRDLIWRRARMIVRNGPDGEVYLPACMPERRTPPTSKSGWAEPPTGQARRSCRALAKGPSWSANRIAQSWNWERWNLILLLTR